MIMSLRKIIICLILAIVMFLLLNLISTKLFEKVNCHEIYILTKDVEEGTTLTSECYKKVEIKDNNFNTLDKDEISINQIENYIVKENCLTGQIITNTMLVHKDDYNKEKVDMEKVFIPIDSKQIIADIYKNATVNIYYTGRTSQLQDITKKLDVDTISSTSITDSYTTFSLIKEAKVIEAYDKNGNKIESTKGNIATSIETISIKVDQQMALLINNIRNYGNFSITIKR